MTNLNLRFRIIDDIASADFVFEAYGKTLTELFSNCAYACFFAMTDPEKVEKTKKIDLSISGTNPEELLYNFMAELIYLKDVEKMFFSGFEIMIANDSKSLEASIFGEAINYDKHEIRTDVKAATFHDLKIISDGSDFRTRMVLDL